MGAKLNNYLNRIFKTNTYLYNKIKESNYASDYSVHLVRGFYRVDEQYGDTRHFYTKNGALKYILERINERSTSNIVYEWK